MRLFNKHIVANNGALVNAGAESAIPQAPAEFAVVDHLPGHAAVDADVFTRDKPSFLRAEKQRHLRDIHRVADPGDGLLHGIGAFVRAVFRVDPAGGEGVDAHFSCKAYR